MIQTYRPDHYSIVRAAQQDYEAFYEEEILYREIGPYPPAAHMLAILITSPEQIQGEELAGRLAGIARNIIEKGTVIGSAKASIGKINDIYRFVIYCKSHDEKVLANVRDRIEQAVAAMELKRESIQFDLDPISSF